MSIKGQGHSLTLVRGHSDYKVKCLTFGLFTQVSDSGPHGPLVGIVLQEKKIEKLIKLIYIFGVCFEGEVSVLYQNEYVISSSPKILVKANICSYEQTFDLLVDCITTANQLF